MFAPGLRFHANVRGNQRRITFLGGDDYKAYLDQLEKNRIQFRVKIYAYCLLPNHLYQLLDTSGTAPLVRKGAEAVALLVRNYGYKVTAVTRYLGYDQANVSLMLSRFAAKTASENRID